LYFKLIAVSGFLKILEQKLLNSVISSPPRQIEKSIYPDKLMA